MNSEQYNLNGELTPEAQMKFNMFVNPVFATSFDLGVEILKDEEMQSEYLHQEMGRIYQGYDYL